MSMKIAPPMKKASGMVIGYLLFVEGGMGS